MTQDLHPPKGLLLERISFDPTQGIVKTRCTFYSQDNMPVAVYGFVSYDHGLAGTDSFDQQCRGQPLLGPATAGRSLIEKTTQGLKH
jgi:hypothetical protein